MRTLDKYMSDRFPIGGQALIHWLEMNAVKRLLSNIGRTLNSILDCPCGYGRLADMLTETGDVVVSGDISPFRMAAHKHHFKAKPEHNLRVNCDITQLPFQDGAFEAIVTFRLFHHLVHAEVRKNVFREAARVARNYFLLSYYSSTPIHELSRRLHRNQEIRKKKKAFLTRDEILQDAEAAGWKLVVSRKVLPVFHAQTVALFEKVCTEDLQVPSDTDGRARAAA